MGGPAASCHLVFLFVRRSDRSANEALFPRRVCVGNRASKPLALLSNFSYIKFLSLLQQQDTSLKVGFYSYPESVWLGTLFHLGLFFFFF